MRMRGILAGTVAAAVIAAVPSPARAGTFDVVACGDAVAGANNSWSSYNSWPGTGNLETGGACGQAGAYGGLYARDELGCTTSCSLPPNEARAGWRFAAPPGTAVSALSYSRWLYKMDDDDWEPALKADAVVVETCAIVYPAYSCSAGAQGGARASRAIANARTLDVGIRCSTNPSGVCDHGATLHRIAAVLYGATVTLTDSSVPSVSNVAGSLFGGGYLSGVRVASFDAADNVGIRSARLYVDGQARPATTFPCDFSFTIPCQNRPGAALSLDTRELADGAHSVQVAASDPAGNERKSEARTMTVDNTAPHAPQEMAVDGGDGWHADNSFAVTWANPSGQTAPIAAVHHQLCTLTGPDCGPAVRSEPSTRITGIAVPAPGEWRLRVWLEDAAGNVDPAQGGAVTLRYAPRASNPGPEPGGGAELTGGQAEAGALTADAPVSAGATLQSPVAGLPARRSSGLRLTSARAGRGLLVIRGRLASGARFRLALTLRLRDGRTVRRTLPVAGGRFRIAIRARRPSRGGIAAVRFAGNAVFRPARSTLRFRA